MCRSPASASASTFRSIPSSSRCRDTRSTTLRASTRIISSTTECTGSSRATTGTRAPGTTAHGSLVGPEAVPLYVLRVPVRYYRRPPVYFNAWYGDAPPRWGEHWGRGWEDHHRGWDRWNRAAVPAPAPLPVYQRQYTGQPIPAASTAGRAAEAELSLPAARRRRPATLSSASGASAKCAVGQPAASGRHAFATWSAAADESRRSPASVAGTGSAGGNAASARATGANEPRRDAASGTRASSASDGAAVTRTTAAGDKCRDAPSCRAVLRRRSRPSRPRRTRNPTAASRAAGKCEPRPLRRRPARPRRPRAPAPRAGGEPQQRGPQGGPPQARQNQEKDGERNGQGGGK